MVPPKAAPLAVAFLDASTRDVSDVDREFAPLATLFKPVESDDTWLKPVDKEEIPVDKEAIPLEVDVDNEVTLPLVADRPVDSEPTFEAFCESPVDSELMPLFAVLKPLEVEVDNEETLLLVDDSPVDNELRLAEVEVDSEFNWLTLTASVFLVPAATLIIRRSLPTEPTDTTLLNPPSVEPAPSTTEFRPVAFAFAPIATEREPAATDTLSDPSSAPSALK
ncbi:MAG: hypothetical protein NVSMB28_13480 [Collimonas sp.]